MICVNLPYLWCFNLSVWIYVLGLLYNLLLPVTVSRYPDMEQTISKWDSTAPQKSSLCHHHHKQVRELLHLSNNIERCF